MIFSDKYSINRRLVITIGFILLSFVLLMLGADRIISSYLQGMGRTGAFVAGFFYTFGVTTPMAMVVILEQMKAGDAIYVAVLSSLSASALDTVLFTAFRDTLETNAKKLRRYYKTRFGKFAWAFPMSGFFVFGLPLPDELGLALVGLSKIRPHVVAVVIFLSKFLTLMVISGAFS